MEAGRAVQCKTVLIDAPYNLNAASDCRAKDISEAGKWILAQD